MPAKTSAVRIRSMVLLSSLFFACADDVSEESTTLGITGHGIDPSTTQADPTDAVGSTSTEPPEDETAARDEGSTSTSSSDEASSSESTTGDIASCGDGIVQPETGEACDDAGESPDCTEQCTFKSWGAAMLIENADGDAGGARVAAGGPSHATVIWHHAGGMGYEILSDRYSEVSGTWSAFAPVAEDADTGYQQIAIDYDGTETAVWHQEDGVTYSIYTSRRSSAAASWPASTLLELEEGVATRPQLTVDGSGNVIVVWSQDDGAYYSIRATRYDISSDAWGGEALLEVDPGDALFPQVATDETGNAIAAWHQHDGIRNDIRASRYDVFTGTWGIAVPLEGADGDATHAQLAINDVGDAVAVWQQLDGAGDSVHASRYDETIDGWEAAVQIDSGAPLHSHRPQVAVSGTGNATVVWFRWDGALSHIYGNFYDAYAGTWAGAALLETEDAGHAANPRVVIDSAGNSIVIWSQDDGVFESIYARRHDAQTATWGLVEPIEADPLDARDPQLAVDDHDNLTAVWRQWDGGQFSISSNRWE
jgi:hypothetical protein